jgi:hypothetical protein
MRERSEMSLEARILRGVLKYLAGGVKLVVMCVLHPNTELRIVRELEHIRIVKVGRALRR